MSPPAHWTGDHDWVTTRQAAGYLRVHIRTVQRWIREGRIEAAKVGGRNRLRRSDVEEILGYPDGRTFPFDPHGLGSEGPLGENDGHPPTTGQSGSEHGSDGRHDGLPPTRKGGQ